MSIRYNRLPAAARFTMRVTHSRQRRHRTTRRRDDTADIDRPNRSATSRVDPLHNCASSAAVHG
jgi:hypothetical protein